MYRHERQARCCAKPLMAGGGLPVDATYIYANHQSEPDHVSHASPEQGPESKAFAP
jgi:hypothetical protein